MGDSHEAVGGSRLDRLGWARLLGVTAWHDLGAEPSTFRAGSAGGWRQLHGLSIESDADAEKRYVTHIWHIVPDRDAGEPEPFAHEGEYAICGSARYVVDGLGAYLDEVAGDGANALDRLGRFWRLHVAMYRPDVSPMALQTMQRMSGAGHGFAEHQLLAASAKGLLGR